MKGHHPAGDLAQVNEILESILSNIGDAVIVAGRDEKFLIFNPAAQRMFGEGATDTTSADWPRRHGLYLPDKVTLIPSDQTPLARAIRGEETNRIEMFVRPAQAQRGLWTRINGRPVIRVQNPLGACACLTNISTRFVSSPRIARARGV